MYFDEETMGILLDLYLMRIKSWFKRWTLYGALVRKRVDAYTHWGKNKSDYSIRSWV
jgi:hypothetical protein